MIILCDREDCSRARQLRERILADGFPAAVSAPASVCGLLPAGGIVTWADCFDELRRTPCDHVFAAVIGDGFVNTALNAACVPDEKGAHSLMRKILPRALGMPERGVTSFGFFLTPRLFFGPDFAEWRGRIVPLTGTERRMLLYLAACADMSSPASAAKLARFCLPEGKQETEGLGNRVAAHAYRINRKFETAAGFRPVRELRGAGYYAEGV